MHGGSAVTWTAIRRNKIRRKGNNLLFHAMPVVIEEITLESSSVLPSRQLDAVSAENDVFRRCT